MQINRWWIHSASEATSTNFFLPRKLKLSCFTDKTQALKSGHLLPKFVTSKRRGGGELRLEPPPSSYSKTHALSSVLCGAWSKCQICQFARFQTRDQWSSQCDLQASSLKCHVETCQQHRWSGCTPHHWNRNSGGGTSSLF